MPNNYFSFKEFTIYQDKCAMKVCTDACLFGAWVAEQLTRKLIQPKQILDIGSGTGLLSMMLAQNTDSLIDAVEINEDAAAQATENIEQSAWKNRITINNLAIQDFSPANQYDLIISNPPFFENDLVSKDENKNSSKHDSTLKLDELASVIRKHLAVGGYSAVLLPFNRAGYFTNVLKDNDLFVSEILLVKQSPSHNYFRAILLFSRENKQPVETNELIIHDSERNYTTAFKALLSPYYLNL